MTAKSVLMRLQGLRPGARASTCPLLCYVTVDPAPVDWTYRGVGKNR